MPNDFAPVVGHRFNFRTRPIGNFDGVVHCEVLACEPPRLLRYSWCGGSDADPAKGSRLDTEVTWTLTPVAGGTHVRMEHDGFMLQGRLRLSGDAARMGQGARPHRRSGRGVRDKLRDAPRGAPVAGAIAEPEAGVRSQAS
jgi:uncharacterized protein YndB with AHSA1/START domain